MTRIERLAYMRVYNRAYKYIKRYRLHEPAFLEFPEGVEALFFKGEEEPEVCFEFSCHRTLTMQEKLFGNRCINHQNTKKVNANSAISYPFKNIFGNIKK